MDTENQTAQEIATHAIKKLRRKIAISRGVLACERFVTSFWPVAILFLFAFTLMYLGVFSVLPVNAFLALSVIFAIILVVLIKSPLRKFSWPSEQAAINRLDIGLHGRPIAGLHDRIALGSGDPAAEYLWALNLKRLADKAKSVNITLPEIRLSGQDRWATRLIVLLLFAVSILFVRGDAGRSLLNGIAPAAQSVASGPSFEAWAEPPSYTGLPTIYLNDVSQDTTLKLPQDSQITLRIYGYDGRASLRETISAGVDASLPEEPQDVLEHTLIVQSSGTFEVSTKLFDDRVWQIEMIPDRAPKIAFGEGISRSIQGEMEVPFVASDDYGVTGGTLTAMVNLDAIERKFGLAREPESQAPLEIEIPMPFAADLTNVDDILVDNQAKHPWASLPSILQLRATDAIGNVGESEPLETNLPGKRFFDTLAAGIVDVRRELLWNRENADRAVYVIKAITHRPDGLFPDEKAYLMVRTALRRMEYNTEETLSDDALVEVTDLLWNAALLIEDGDLDDAKERLRRAQERLQEAMENGATKEEIEELMQELRDATENYLAQLERRQGDEQQQSSNQGETISQDQIQQMMDEIQELMEQGRMEEAQALMEQLQKLLEEMRYVEMQPGSGGENSEDLQQTLRDQQELADDTFQELQEEFDRQRQQQNGQEGQQGQQQQGNQQGQQQGQQQGNQQGKQQGQQQGQQQGNQQGQQGGQQQGQQGQQQGRQQGQNGGSQNEQRGGQGGSGLAERQEALRRMLRGQRGGVPNDGSEAGQAARDALEQAERNMDAARENLENGNVAGALDNQSDAMDSLREGMRQMNEQSRQAQQGQQQGNEGQSEGQGQGLNPNGRATALDPLGRSQGGMFNDTLTPNGLGEENAKRQNEVLEEIKRRSNERTRPELELDYLKRLLDRF